MSNKNNQKISSAELSIFCGQVALILEAGLPLYDGMETLAGADTNSENAEMFQKASEGVTQTGSLYEALKDDDRWPEYMVEMVGIGERSGHLESIMRGLETYYAREDRIKSSIVSAVTYPIMLAILLAVIVLILLWRVLPVFRRVLEGMGVGLNESGAAMMHIGEVVGWVVMVLVVILIIAALAIIILMQTKHREKVMKFLERIFPPIVSLNNKLTASRISGVLSMMLSSGFPIDEALEMTEKVLPNSDAAGKIQHIRKSMEDGKSFADAIGETDIFNELHVRMIKMGSATGREDQVLGKLSNLYEEQVEEDITRLVGIIEPTLVALLSIVIGAVLLAVILPMAGILSSL